MHKSPKICDFRLLISIFLSKIIYRGLYKLKGRWGMIYEEGINSRLQ